MTRNFLNLFCLVLFVAYFNDYSAQIPTLYNTLFEDEFYADTLSENWSTKSLHNQPYSLSSQNGMLHLFCNENSIQKNKNYNLLFQPLKHPHFLVSTTLNFNPKKNGEEAGFCIYIDSNNYLLFDLKKEDNETIIQLLHKPSNKAPYLQKDLVLNNYNNHIEFKVKTIGKNYYFSYRLKSNDLWENFDQLSLKKTLNSDNNSLQIGLYSTSNGQKSKNYAAFDVFRYYGLKN